MDCDFLILADSADVKGNKLYMLGGGWTIINARSGLPTSLPIAVVAGILVGWNETNRRHQFRIEIRSDDSTKTLLKVEGEFEQGRPTGLPAGMEQRTILTFGGAPKIEVDGPYTAQLWINGRQVARTGFQVLDHTKLNEPSAMAEDAPG